MKIAHRLFLNLSALFGLSTSVRLNHVHKDNSETSSDLLDARIGQTDSTIASLSLPETTELLQTTPIIFEDGALQSKNYDNLQRQSSDEISSSTTSRMTLASPTTPQTLKIKSKRFPVPITIDPSVKTEDFEVERQRKLLRVILRGVNDTWQNAHIPEKNGKPFRNIIISTWRSGSSFLGEMISSFPGTLHFYEPFMYLMSERIRDPEKVKKSIKMTKSLFDCEFDYPEWTNNSGLHMSGLLSRSPLKNICLKIPGACEDPKFISRLCKLFPIQFTKFVRLRLPDAEELLRDERYDTRLLYLVRDPRGTMKSRKNGSSYWCDLNPDCYDEGRLCSDLEDDYAIAVKLREQYPNRFMVKRYEDVAMNVPLAAESILSFFQLRYHPRVKLFVLFHSTVTKSDEFGTFRKSSKVAFNWLKYYRKNAEMLERIQGSCSNAMDLWGYRALGKNRTLLSDIQHVLKNSSGLGPLLLRNPPWDDMRME